MLTEDEIRAIEEQASKATLGPWLSGPLTRDAAGDYVVWRPNKRHGRDYIGNVGSITEPVVPNNVEGLILFDAEASDAAFIAAARTNVPLLCKEVRRLQAENLELKIDRADLDTGHAEAHAEIDKLQAENARLREALERTDIARKALEPNS